MMVFTTSSIFKTTYSEKYENVIHLDEEGRRIFETVEKSEGDIVIEGIFILRSMREKLLKSYKGDGKKVCIWLDISPEECERRENRNRGAYMIWNCFNAFEPPTLEEGWDEIIRIECICALLKA